MSRPGGGSTYNFNARNWAQADRIAGIATLLVLISLFLPWFSVNLAGLSDLGVTGGVATESGTDAHGWLWVVFVIGLLVLIYLGVTAGFRTLPVNLPLKHEVLLLGATGINCLLVVIGFLAKPGNEGVAGVKIGWGFGAVVGLIAAIVAVVPLARAAIGQSNTNRVR